MEEKQKNIVKNFNDIQKYLEVEKNRIIAKKECEIFIDKNEYKEDEIIETTEYFILPGVLEIYIPEDDVYILLPFTYNIYVQKPDTIVDEKDFIILKYKPGEIIIEQKYKDTLINFNTIIRYFQGQMKFVKSPEQLVNILQELMDYTVDQVYLEVLVQQLYRCKDDESKPCRLCSSNYKNCTIVPIPQLPYKLSWILGLGFERIDKAIKNALINKTEPKNTSLEKLLIDY